MNLVITGPRHWCHSARFVHDQLDHIRSGALRFYAGDARGVDAIGLDWARTADVPCSRFVAEWTRYGRGAGVRRSAEMLDAALAAHADHSDAVLLIAFVNAGVPLSAGTSHTVRLAHDKCIPSLAVSPDGRVWRSPPTGERLAWVTALEDLRRSFGLSMPDPQPRLFLALPAEALGDSNVA